MSAIAKQEIAIYRITDNVLALPVPGYTVVGAKNKSDRMLSLFTYNDDTCQWWEFPTNGKAQKCTPPCAWHYPIDTVNFAYEEETPC